MRTLVYRLVTGLETAAVLLRPVHGFANKQSHVIPTGATPCGAERRDLAVRALVYRLATVWKQQLPCPGLFTVLQTSRATSSRLKRRPAARNGGIWPCEHLFTGS